MRRILGRILEGFEGEWYELGGLGVRLDVLSEELLFALQMVEIVVVEVVVEVVRGLI